MQDVRVQRGADAASDHHLVLATMKMKLKNREVKRNTRTQYSVDFLKDRLTRKTFRLTVRNKYEALQDIPEEGNKDTDTQRQQINEMWTEHAAKLWERRNTNEKTGFLQILTRKCNWGRKRKVPLTTAEREQQNNTTGRVHWGKQSRQEQRKNRQGKCHWVSSQRSRGCIRPRKPETIIWYNKKISRKVKYKHIDRPTKGNNGNVLTNDEDRPPPQNFPGIALAEEELQRNSERTSKTEIEKTTWREDMGARRNANWMERRVPREAPKERRYARMSELQWDNAHISNRKGPQQSHLGQTDGLDAKLRDHQAGFRKDKSCTDHTAESLLNSRCNGTHLCTSTL